MNGGTYWRQIVGGETVRRDEFWDITERRVLVERK